MKSKFRAYTLDDWLTHIQSQHWRTIDLKLDRIEQVWNELDGQRSDFVVTVAGTNGKGSCVAMLESALRECGMKTGSYTSPHLIRYNERVKIDGSMASDSMLCDAFYQIEASRKDIPLTYFEFGTLCALLIFQHQQVEAAVLEVGMGGRLDAVNLIDNDIALITSVGIDHDQWLGTDRNAIAAEKAGVLKHYAMAVCAEPDPPPCIKQIAANRNCTLLQSGTDYQVRNTDTGITWWSDHPAIPSGWRSVEGLKSPFEGDHQRQNLGGVIAALALTSDTTGISHDIMAQGLDSTRLPARCQMIASDPEVILDVAHNHDSARELATFLSSRQRPARTLGVVGMLADKPGAEIFTLLTDKIDEWYLATLSGERGQTAENLAVQLDSVNSQAAARLFESPVLAYLAAMKNAGPGDRVVIFGSFYTVGDIMGFLEQEGDWNVTSG